MRSRAHAVLVVVVLLPFACSSNGASLADFTAACVTNANLSEEICRCVATKAQNELSDDGFAFLTATLQGDDDRVAALRGTLAIPEAVAAGMFMVSGPARCARDLSTS